MKTVMITDTVYRDLSKIKGKKSFSELFQYLLDATKNTKASKLALLASLKGNLTDEEAEEAEAIIGKLRATAKVRL